MTSRSRFLSAGFAAALVLASCGGGSSEQSNSDDDQTDNAETTDPIVDAGDSIITEPEPVTSEEPEPEPATTDEAEPAPEPPDDNITPQCAIVNGDLTDAEFEAIECSEPHDAELAGVVPAPDGIAPTDETDLDIVLASVCLDAVEQLAGSSLTVFGPEVAYATDVMPGQSFFGEIECWLRTPAFETLTGSLRDVDLETALGEFVTLGSVQPGECFIAAEPNIGSVSVGRLVDCADRYAEQILGSVTIDDASFPGTDELFAMSDDVCPALADEVSFDIAGDSIGAIVMFETEWEAYGIRDIVCYSYRSADFEGPICAIQIPSESHDQVPCDEPHDSEFVVSVPPPEGRLPADSFDAEVLVTAHCAPSVSEFLGGRDLSTSGVGVGFDANTGLGDPFEADVNCWVNVGSPSGLVGSIAEIGLDAALGDNEILAELDPGTCFTFAEDTFDLGPVVPCETPDALMSVGSFQVDDDGPHPGDDPLRAIRFERCSAILAESGLAADPASVSGTFPNAVGWTAVGRRTITCDATPL